MTKFGAKLLLAVVAVCGFASGASCEELRKFALTPVTLADADGHAVSTADFHGKFLLVYFGYTHCADLCPTGLSILSEALSEIGPAASNIQPIFITVDPMRDTGEILRSFPAAFDKRMIGLGGTEAQIAAAAKAFGVDYKKVATGEGGDYDIAHSVEYILVDRDGTSATAIAAAAPYEIDQVIIARLTKDGVDLSKVPNAGAYR